jgi:Outer membrane protein beta-barrel domain
MSTDLARFAVPGLMTSNRFPLSFYPRGPFNGVIYMTRYSILAGAGMMVLLAGAPASAQEELERGPGVVFSVGGGGFSPLTELDELGEVDFRTGYSLGGSLAYEFNRYWAIRGNFAFARSEGRATADGLSPIAGSKFNRFIYDADVQVGYPFSGGVKPYVFVGGGAITVDPDTTPEVDTFTKGAGKFGVGVSYQIPRSNVRLYIEGAGWVYKWDRYGFDKTQFDTTWGGGISYRFGS